jgi:opacity protein-like surface antigen
MKRTTIVLTVLALLGSAAQAQVLPLPRAEGPQDGGGINEIGGGFAAGLSSAPRNFGRIGDPGVHVTAFLTVRPPRAMIGDRVEATFNQFHYADAPGLAGGHVRLLSLTVNGLINTTGPMHPYVIGGFGFYRASSTCGGCTANWTRPGANVGAGLQVEVGVAQAFFEVRGHYIASQVDPAPAAFNTGGWFVPVSFGVKF